MLSSLIKHYEDTKLIQGIRICRNALVISHMLFADDSYLFCKTEVTQAVQIWDLLTVYKLVSGQQINKNKSSTFFSVNVIDYNRDLVCHELQFQQADSSTRYLGHSNTLGKNKSAVLSNLKKKVKASIRS